MRSIVVCTVLLLLLSFSAHSATLIVPDNHPTIQAAIDNADEGDTVEVRIGIWKESVVLKDGISLIGESMRETVLRGKRRKPVITAGNKTLIKNLTVSRGLKGILCENADATIEQVIITDNRETGIHCHVTLPAIYNCVIYRNNGSGIFCQSTRSIKTAIMHNVIAENGYCGILLQGVSEVLIQNNVFLENKQFGVWGVQEARRTRIVYNLFYNNRRPVNVYLIKDPSNITADPGYPIVANRYDFFSTSSIILKGKGKDGATIGLIGGEVLSQKINDPDEDGIIGDDDKCPSIPEDVDNFEDDDGCPEFDNDKDGIFDTQDACPNDPEDYDGFRDDDGCNDTDNDKDGIPDSVDICKGSPETMNGYKDTDGCPDEIPPGGQKPATDQAVSPQPDSTAPVKKQSAEKVAPVKESAKTDKKEPASGKDAETVEPSPADTTE